MRSQIGKILLRKNGLKANPGIAAILAVALTGALTGAMTYGLSVSSAWAHGAIAGGVTGATALLIFPVAAVLFVLFLVFMRHKKGWTVLVTGGAGYIGSALIAKLLASGHKVVVLDHYPHGDEVFSDYRGYLDLRQIKGDFRDKDILDDALSGCDAVIHLAGVTEDTILIRDPEAAKSINLDAFRPLVRAAKNAGVKRFIYASSFQVYGAQDDVQITEELPLQPASDFSRHKAECEEILNNERAPGFVTCAIRAAEVCGYAPCLRLDGIVNGLTRQALIAGGLEVFSAGQKIPNIHIDDIVELYSVLLRRTAAQIDGKAFNAGAENLTHLELAERVKTVIGEDLSIKTAPSDDLGSYQISSERARRELRFEPKQSVEDAVRGLVLAVRNGEVQL